MQLRIVPLEFLIELWQKVTILIKTAYITDQIMNKVPLHVLAKQAGISEALIEQNYSQFIPIMFMEELTGKGK